MLFLDFHYRRQLKQHVLTLADDICVGNLHPLCELRDILSELSVAQSSFLCSVLYIIFVGPISFDHCIVCPSICCF
jgi:hypothetical protein